MTEPGEEIEGQMELFDYPAHLGRVKINAGYENGVMVFMDVVIYRPGINARTITTIAMGLADVHPGPTSAPGLK